MKVHVDFDFEPNEEAWKAAEEAVNDGCKNFTILKNGQLVEANQEIKILFGPVVGNVTSTTAIVIIEASSKECNEIQCQLFANDQEEEPVALLHKDLGCQKPQAFVFQDLVPDTTYTAIFTNILSPTTKATFKTKKEEDMKTFKLIALSCDRPSRLLLGQLNPWKYINRIVKTGRVDCVLHIGDQIYPDSEDIQHAAKIFGDIFDSLPPSKQADMMARGRELWREKYRTNFNQFFKREVVANVSNLMIWSDNDVANDFTTLKNPETGEQAYHPKFLQCGMQVFREYQRRLWDPECEAEQLQDEVQEYHCHTYGQQVGIFLFDLRGNRITPEGVQHSENPLISDSQWIAFEDFLANPELRAVILCSETPFIGEEPSACIDKVQDNLSMDFLRDHWSFNEQDLVRLVELCFAWKGEGDGTRDLLMISGDIHCGVTTVLTDEESGLQINHYTTSPVTNHVCSFFPPLMGSLNERFHFHHLPLGKNFRNFLDVDIHIDDDTTSIQAKLVPISTDVFKNDTWPITEQEEDEIDLDPR